MKNVLGAIGAVIIWVAVAAGLMFGGFYAYQYFAPKYEGVRRDVMIESRAYSEATVRELYRMKRQYESAETEAERATIRAAALHEFSIFPEDRLPNDLRVWFHSL